MNEECLNTKEQLLECAKKEFLAKGFKNSSLRNICKMAGVTTGAVYGYFKDKDSIFVALVQDAIDGLKNLIDEIENGESEEDIFKLVATKEDRVNLVQTHNRYVDYVYDNFDSMKLIILHSDGSSVENCIEEISKGLIQIDENILKQLDGQGIHVEEFVLHMLVKFYVTSICELVRYNIPHEQALKYMTTLSIFFFAGWAELLKTKNDKLEF